MFRFWSSDASRGCDKLADDGSLAKLPHPTPATTPTATDGETSPSPFKRRRSSFDQSAHATVDALLTAKRARHDVDGLVAPTCFDGDAALPASAETSGMERACDAIQYQFGFEILRKHDELRLINQELAKCQIALEQLRRCHLIPYPTSCPTPDQMLEISSGKGPAVRTRPGEPVPQWAPPFGVVDGPYARHYAKWLIPDPKFDGMQPEWQPLPEMMRSRTSLEGRTTRNSAVDLGGFGAKRQGRGMASSKLHSLSNGYPPPKDKAGPCVLKRSDGQTVKLVCIDCHRENFSSTQGFINHCRIAHRRDFKSHEEAAVACGHPLDADRTGSMAGEEKAAGTSTSTSVSVSASASTSAPAVHTSGLVHPFARTDMTEQQAYRALQSRIQESLKMYHQGKLPGITSIPAAAAPKPAPAAPNSPPAEPFAASADVPYLSRLLQSRKFEGDLGELVADAKKQDVFEEVWSPGEESEDIDPISTPTAVPDAAVGARAPAMRVPARSAKSPAPMAPVSRPTSSRARSPALGFASLASMSMLGKDDRPSVMMLHDEDVDMDVDLSPNTLVSNNAPSLVSDDGEYDDSDDGSSESDAGDSLDGESVSDVAEITIDEDQEPPRSLRHHRGSSGAGAGPVRIRKDDKHVTFVSPVKNNTSAKERRPRKV